MIFKPPIPNYFPYLIINTLSPLVNYLDCSVRAINSRLDSLIFRLTLPLLLVLNVIFTVQVKPNKP